mmetsp:Transcript_53721/g.123128  ORF Transcript_53721/g.123128 Transcript_53721/m.123128 type:complete len:275 (-) Transcript_53721:1642-2466(-)
MEHTAVKRTSAGRTVVEHREQSRDRAGNDPSSQRAQPSPWWRCRQEPGCPGRHHSSFAHWYTENSPGETTSRYMPCCWSGIASPPGQTAPAVQCKHAAGSGSWDSSVQFSPHTRVTCPRNTPSPTRAAHTTSDSNDPSSRSSSSCAARGRKNFARSTPLSRVMGKTVCCGGLSESSIGGGTSLLVANPSSNTGTPSSNISVSTSAPSIVVLDDSLPWNPSDTKVSSKAPNVRTSANFTPRSTLLWDNTTRPRTSSHTPPSAGARALRPADCGAG